MLRISVLLLALAAHVGADGPLVTSSSTAVPSTTSNSATVDGTTVAKAVVAPSFVPNSHFTVSGQSATKLGQFCWKTIEIGSWFSSGRRHANIRLDSVSDSQSPGVSVALGVLFSSLEGRVNDQSVSTESCGSGYHWSVRYGHGDGLAYLGNKWGTAFGPRLASGDTVTMLADIDAQTVAYAVNGVCHGALAFSSSRVSLAASLEMEDTFSLEDTTLEDVPACLVEAPVVSGAVSRARGMMFHALWALAPVGAFWAQCSWKLAFGATV